MSQQEVIEFLKCHKGQMFGCKDIITALNCSSDTIQQNLYRLKKGKPNGFNVGASCDIGESGSYYNIYWWDE